MPQRKDVTGGRRAVILAAPALGASWLAGCAAWLTPRPVRICRRPPDVSLPVGPLTVDAHCHVFNGTDLQIKDFLSKVAVTQRGALGAGAKLLGDVLQHLAWSLAPNGDAELAELQVIGEAMQSCANETVTARLGSLRQTGYSTGREQLQAAVGLSTEFRTLRDQIRATGVPRALDEDSMVKFNAVRLIDNLPVHVESYQTAQGTRNLTALSLKERSVQGLIDFVLQNFQYRSVSVYDYLSTYNEPGIRVIDLMLPSLVDYDWWLSKGAPTLTSLRTQVEVMRQIAILTEGRVHSFVPYDPLRQIAFDLHFSNEDSFGLVKYAVEERGCVGVKLYPPMGFAPLGNRQVKGPKGANFWARDWLPAWTNRADLGNLLDEAMIKLLTWCQAKQVPVMAHTSLSNGVAPDFEALAGSSYWAIALAAFPRLRVSFGHFGDTELVEDGLGRARAFAELMNSSSAGPGAFAYADAAYFAEILESEPALLKNLRTLYEETAAKGSAALANRFMYGTDWEMTLVEGSVTNYLTQFVQLLDQLEKRPAIRAQGLKDLSARFFGLNAVQWLGLRTEEPARTRLDTFYAANGIPKPDWATKVDRLR